MVLNQKTATTDVIFSKSVKLDFDKCCRIFVDNENIILNGDVKQKSIWQFPHLVKYFVKDEANRAIVELVFETVCNYEKKFAGAGLSFLRIARNSNGYSIKKPIRASSTTIVQAVQKNIECGPTKKILQQIRKYGNPQLSISVQRSPVEKPLLKFESTPKVRLRVSPNFYIGENKFKNCYFFMVNGAVSTASEITKILYHSFENKEKTYFLVCKSFNDEVLYTLKENYDRGITNVIPVEFGFDLDSINSLADLHSIVGGLPLSSDLGDVLSAADISRSGFSESVVVYNDRFNIKPSKSCKGHINRLMRQIQESDHEKRKLLSKRLISLRGNSCNVYLPDHSSFDNVELNIRHSVLLMNQMSKYGMAEIKTGKNKFYIPATSCTIIKEIKNKVEDLLQTKVFLPRRNP